MTEIIPSLSGFDFLYAFIQFVLLFVVAYWFSFSPRYNISTKEIRGVKSKWELYHEKGHHQQDKKGLHNEKTFFSKMYCNIEVPTILLIIIFQAWYLIIPLSIFWIYIEIDAYIRGYKIWKKEKIEQKETQK